MSVRLEVFVLLAIVTHVAVASANEPPRIARGGEAWLQDDLDDLIERYPIDPRRLVITGASNGGYATWDIICRHPDKFMAAIPVCGGGDPLSAARLVNVPIWATHGDRDPYAPVKGSRNMIRYLRQAGGFPRYTEIAGAGHNVWGQAWSNDEVRPWAFDETPPTAVKGLAAKVVRGRDVRLTKKSGRSSRPFPPQVNGIIFARPEGRKT